MVLADGKILMNSRHHGAEPELARVGWRGSTTASPKVLVGGLGFGFTLRAALDVAPDLARVMVNEPSKAVVEWNRGPLASLNGHALDDPRVTVEVGDVQRVLSKHRRGFDVILLDIDNGPFAVDIDDDQSLYSIGGLVLGARLAQERRPPGGGLRRHAPGLQQAADRGRVHRLGAVRRRWRLAGLHRRRELTSFSSRPSACAELVEALLEVGDDFARHASGLSMARSSCGSSSPTRP